MNSAFWFGYHLKNFLFYGCDVHSVPVLLATCVAVAALAFLFEFVKLLQVRQRQKELIIRARQLKTICPVVEETTLLPSNQTMHGPLDVSVNTRARLYAVDAVIWLSMNNVGYLLMLVVMAYNVWIFVAVIVGGGIGQFLFGQKLMKLNMENCQVIRDTYCMGVCGNPGAARDGESTPVLEPSTSGSCHGTSSTVNVAVHEVDDKEED